MFDFHDDRTSVSELRENYNLEGKINKVVHSFAKMITLVLFCNENLYSFNYSLDFECECRTPSHRFISMRLSWLSMSTTGPISNGLQSPAPPNIGMHEM